MKFSTVLVAALLAITAFSMVFSRHIETERRLEMADVPGAQSEIQSGGHPEIIREDDEKQDFDDEKDGLDDEKDDFSDDEKQDFDDEKDGLDDEEDDLYDEKD